jgi:hypothetical protein
VATTVGDRLGANVGGQAHKRGLIPRTPAGDRLLADAAVWFAADYPDAVRSTRQRTLANGEAELAIDLHPATPPLRITASDEGRIVVASDTALAGPGYHRFVGRVLERLGAEVGIEWTDGDGAMTFADRQAVERAYLSWLGPQLARARVAVRRGERRVHLGMPAGTRFLTDGALLTALGPRDEAWLESAIADPRVALEITPWWADATDGRYLLNRALVLMWSQVRWRPPAVEGEADLLDEVHRLLSRAYPMEPGAGFPWRAWAQLVAYRGIEDQMARQAVQRAGNEPDPETPVGYRRGDVHITHEGWGLDVPGTYAERRTPEEWWGGGAGRSITLAATATATHGGAPMPAEMFIEQFAADLGRDALSHRAGAVVGRARLTTDASSGVEVGVLEGYSAVLGSGAAIRIEFHDAGDWQWAVETWRSLAPG